MSEPQIQLQYLRSAQAIRERTGQVFSHITADQSKWFTYDDSKLEATTQYVLEVIKSNYPSLEVPFHSRWRHFIVNGDNRLDQLINQIQDLPSAEKGRRLYELVILSVLLDAGAGAQWQYLDQKTGTLLQRSEGLAIATFDMFCRGFFSDDGSANASTARLQSLSMQDLADGFQVTPDNPLLGLESRLALIHRLGKTIASKPTYFGDSPRLGGLFEYVSNQKTNEGIPASDVLTAVLNSLSDIWDDRIKFNNHLIGDVWRHKAATATDATTGLVPFHKLSQWLTYSLLEPLMWDGTVVTGVDQLTGLAEYRNGGLLIDTGLLVPKSPQVTSRDWSPDHEVIIEWRSATVQLLDVIAKRIQHELGKTPTTFPLACVLEGGTWAAGRKIASQKRDGGLPPLNIISQGTLF
jgi:hypothetical protein